MIQRSESGRQVESGGDVLECIRSERLSLLRTAERDIRENDALVPGEISVPAWNALQTRWVEAADAVIHDSKLMAELRRALPNVVDPRDRRLLAQLLLVPLLDLRPEAAGILADPRVTLTADQVDIAPAIYLVDADPDPDNLPLYDADDAHPDEPNHGLTRMGGLPTAGPWDRPDTVFLLQIDLSTLSETTAVEAFLASTRMPRDGLLQLFHTTQGDSRTDPHLPGGGATLCYVPEPLLTRRRRSEGEALFPVKQIVMEILPAFRFGAGAGTDETFLEVITLQARADTLARRDTWYADGADRPDPFDEHLPTSSRMLGIQWFDVDVGPDGSEETQTVLARDLPLRDPHDRHLLLFDITSDTVFDGLFGADGRLEIWMRASDPAAGDFSGVVSFLRST